MKIKQAAMPLFNLRLPADLKAKLDALAKRDKRTWSAYVRVVLEAHTQKPK